MTKKIILNAFTQASVSPHAIGLWKHPDHEGHRHTTTDHWVRLAQKLEKGGFQAIFFADVIGFYDVYEGSARAALEQSVQVPAHDPLLLISAIAHATERIGFAVTASATYVPPYQLARQLSTLDHLTDGRIGWNIVTSYLESEAVNFGLDGLIPHDERYDRAEEYLDVVYKLWERSWDDGAVVRDVARNQYIDPSKVRPINHRGHYFNVPGAALVEPSRQRTPLLFQAGASPRGRDFATKHAEAIFTNTQNQKNATVELRAFERDITERLAKHSRSREDVAIIPAVVVVVGETEEAAKEKFEYLKSFVDYDGAAALLSGHSGIDFSQFDPDSYVEQLETDAIQSRLENYTSTNPDHRWTVREAILYHGLTLGSEAIVGTPEQIVDRLEELVVEGGVDGFNIRQTVSPSTLEEFIDYVVPELVRRGLYETSYDGETIREHYFGKGNERLAPSHYAHTVALDETKKEAIAIHS